VSADFTDRAVIYTQILLIITGADIKIKHLDLPAGHYFDTKFNKPMLNDAWQMFSSMKI